MYLDVHNFNQFISFINADPLKSNYERAVGVRRLSPLSSYLGSYFKRPKSSPVRPLACNGYYGAQFVAKPRAACALRFSWSATTSKFGL